MMIAEGQPIPAGVTREGDGWNFALYSRHATGVTLLLYGAKDFIQPVLEVKLHPLENKTGRIWHCFVPHVADARYYAYRVEGPTGARHQFDAQKVLLDPFAKQVFFPPDFSRAAAMKPGANDGRAPLGVLPVNREPRTKNREPTRPRHAWHEIVIYELHVKGFTARVNSGVMAENRGTFLGLIEKIPYLKELGVTVVELLPVHQFDPQEGNYWGYMTLNFFAPHQDYGSAVEFREMVRAFHAAGIEVWLDVVYNHTCEGDHTGPTYSWRGIDNSSYYLHRPDGQYSNDSGCGNMLRCGRDAARMLVLESLRHWADLGVDGFRFDLASAMARDAHGQVQTEDAALISEITALALTRKLRVVAEAWDIGVNLLGKRFPGWLWGQWNGQYRDDVRAFVRGDAGMVGALMRRLYGSDDLFPDGPGDVYRPYQSVNFVTAHDGFCLYDLVSFNQKRNQEGSDDNLSWNCGWEGDEGAPAEVLALRRQQVKNFFCLLMLSNGTPMFCAGDEFLNTQRGNNNPYNQDNETTWLDWSKLEKNRDIFEFFKRMIAFRKAHPAIASGRYWREAVRWYGAFGPVDFNSHCLAYSLDNLYVMINAFWGPVRFQIQQPGAWNCIVDTSRQDLATQAVDGLDYEVAPRCVVVLERT